MIDKERSFNSGQRAGLTLRLNRRRYNRDAFYRVAYSVMAPMGRLLRDGTITMRDVKRIIDDSK